MEISWDAMRELDVAYGDSFFLVDLDAFQANYLEFTAAFRAWYPKTTIGYSYKTNYIPRLCALVQEMGGYAEVVSAMELQLARRIGVPSDRIIFNGPYKGDRDLEDALLSGSICNLDSADEIAVVEAAATRQPEARLALGLRCNFDIGSDRVSRFGFDVQDPGFHRAVERLRGIPNCELAGLHFHSSTGHRSLESYTLRTKRMLELSAECFPSSSPRFVNVGGGYFSRMDEALRAQFTDPVPGYEEYAESVAAQVAAFYGPDGPELIVEPGTAIVADVMRFVARVVGVKRVRSRAVALVAGSIHNIKPTLHGKAVPMSVVRASDGAGSDDATSEIDIVGYTCMEHDVLAEKYAGPVGPGDYVVFGNVGAYTIVMKPPFIRPSPPVLARRSGSAPVEVLRRAETTEDVFATYAF